MGSVGLTHTRSVLPLRALCVQRRCYSCNFKSASVKGIGSWDEYFLWRSERPSLYFVYMRQVSWSYRLHFWGVYLKSVQKVRYIMRNFRDLFKILFLPLILWMLNLKKINPNLERMRKTTQGRIRQPCMRVLKGSGLEGNKQLPYFLIYICYIIKTLFNDFLINLHQIKSASTFWKGHPVNLTRNSHSRSKISLLDKNKPGTFIKI